MKQLFCIVLLLTSLFADRINVVTTIPDIANMVEEIGGEFVRVKSLATGREDLHAVPPRPSFLPLLNRADLLIALGLDAEHSWLPSLAKESRNSAILKGKEGYIDLSEGIKVLGVPTVLDRSEGEQHAEGNPHYNIGAQSGVIMASNICLALSEHLPTQSDHFHQNCKRYLTEVKSMVTNLEAQGEALQGKKVICYHPDVAYLAEFYGLEVVGSIEPKAGVAPKASHLRNLTLLAQKEGVDFILYNQAQSPKLPKKLAKSLKIPAIQVANAVGAKKEIDTWIDLQEYNLNQMLKAMK